MMVVIGLLLLAGILLVLGRTVTADGYGHRPPPRSHRDEVDDRWTVGR